MEIPKSVWEEFPEDMNIRNDYSGRGMFGETCFAITGDDPITLGVILGRHLGNEALFIAQKMRKDQMGRGMVYYFPGVTLEDYDD